MRRIVLTAAFAVTTLIGPMAQAAPFYLRYSGILQGGQDTLVAQSGGPNLITSDQAFTFSALFDTSSPNLVAALPVPGFVAYAPTSATLTIGGTTFVVPAFTNANPSGVAVTIFDRSNVFNPNLYGIGFFADPLNDGPGIVGDFASASPDFSVNNLVSTTFTNYNGAGYAQGYNCGPTHTACPVAPLPIRGTNGVAYNLTFAGRDIQGGPGAATLSAVPEPATWAMLIIGFGMTGATMRWRAQDRPRRRATLAR